MLRRPAGITLIAGPLLAHFPKLGASFGASAFSCPAASAVEVIWKLYRLAPFSAMS